MASVNDTTGKGSGKDGFPRVSEPLSVSEPVPVLVSEPVPVLVSEPVGVFLSA